MALTYAMDEQGGSYPLKYKWVADWLARMGHQLGNQPSIFLDPPPELHLAFFRTKKKREGIVNGVN